MTAIAALLRLPEAVNRCLFGCALHLRRHPALARDRERLRRELCPGCATIMRALAKR